MMGSVETIITLMFAAVLLIGVAQKMHVPYPIALVLGGTAIGFIPGLHPLNFDPNLILVIVLPPILYYGSFGIAYREFQKNWKVIFSLALGLVVFTTLVIGVIFKWMFPQYSWALAFAFGAIMSPPDVTAATAILKRFSISSRLLAILEGESLINDASAIVLYRIAVVALLSGSFSVIDGGIEFFKGVFGGILIGVITGFLLQLFSRKYLEPVLGVVFSFTIPYITYVLASWLEVSGVLAVVVNGLIGSRILLTHHSSLRRVLGYATWDIFILLLNCFVFILIGLQLRGITQELTREQLLLYTGYAVLISAAMVLVRMMWVYGKAAIAYVKALSSSKAPTLCPQILREAALISWSGMRGIVSLAVALGLPYYLSNGMPLEGRNVVIFMTFVVILITIIIPGLTLPTLIRWLKIQHYSKSEEETNIRNELTKIAKEHLSRLLNTQSINQIEYDFLKSYFQSHLRVLEMSHHAEHRLPNVEEARLKIIQSQRKKLIEMWERGEIDDRLLTHMENELDVEEIHIARAELK